MAEVYLLARWQGFEKGRHAQYETAIGQIMDFLRLSRSSDMGKDLNLVAAARAARTSACAPSEAILRCVETCIEIQQASARAFSDRDTSDKPSTQGAAHMRLANMLTSTLGILKGDDDDNCIGTVSQQELVGSSHSFRALCFMLDLDDVMHSVSSIWNLFKSGEVGLVRATIVTNNCVAFVREVAETLTSRSPHIRNLETIVTEIYMQPAVEMLQKDHALPYERAVELVTGIHEGFQRNLETLEKVKDGKVLSAQWPRASSLHVTLPSTPPLSRKTQVEQPDPARQTLRILLMRRLP